MKLRLPGRLTVGHLPMEENILGSNPSPAANKKTQPWLVFLFAVSMVGYVQSRESALRVHSTREMYPDTK